jgi:enamine deaminase RidA (YjgF/YER057c/UK114 family)
MKPRLDDMGQTQNRLFAWPKNHWDWPIRVSHKHGVRSGLMIYVGGQVDLDSVGTVRHPDDLDRQTDAAIEYLARVLQDLGADLDDVVKLSVYYRHATDVDEVELLRRMRRRVRVEPAPAVTAIPLPRLAYPGMAVEIEAIAMRGPGDSRLPRVASQPQAHWTWPAGAEFSHGLRCGDLIFLGGNMALDDLGTVPYPKDIVEQAKLTLANIRKVLVGFGAEMDDIVKLNTFYVGHGTLADWEKAAQIRSSAFKKPGPVATGVPVPGPYPNGLLLRQDAVAVLGAGGLRPARQTSWPPGQWNWPIPVSFQQGLKVGQTIFVGGQVSADSHGRPVHPNDMDAQTRASMDHIQNILAGFGVTLDSVIKVNCFYRSGGTPDELHRNLAIRSSYFREPGPATTGIPLENLGLEGLTIEIEAIATTDH